MRLLMKRALMILLITVLCVNGAPVFCYAVPAAVAGQDQTVAAGNSVTGFIDENNVLYMTGLASKIPWHKEGLVTTAYGDPICDVPVRVMDQVRSISFEDDVYAVIRTDGSLWMWGNNYNGVIGNGGAYESLVGSNKMQYTPVKIMENVEAVSVTHEYAGAIKTDGSLWMWGKTAFVQNKIKGDLDDGAIISRPVKIMDGVRSVSCGGICAVVKTDGTLWCWEAGEGIGYQTFAEKAMDHVSFVSDSMFVLKDDGKLYSVRVIPKYKLGYDLQQSVPVSQRLESQLMLEHVVQVTSSRSKSGAVTEDGSLYIWGYGVNCGLGDGNMALEFKSSEEESWTRTPKKIMDDVVGIYYSNMARGFALKKDGTVWGWGENPYSELGNGRKGDLSLRVSGVGGSRSIPVQSTPIQIMTGIRTTNYSGQPSVPAVPAMDPNPSAWAKSIVERAIEMKLVPENLQGNYAKPITRAEFCALAAMLYESRRGEVTERSTFTDTKDVNVEKMASLGVVAGIGNNKFAPDRNITREQAAAMLAALAGVLGKPIEETEPAFADNGDISSWAVPYVGKMQSSGIMNGTGNGKFSPQGSYTREQSIATMLSVLAYVEE